MPWALTALQFALASVLVLAAVAKFLQADEFLGALRLSHVPDRAVPWLAVAVPVGELGLGLWLLLAGPSRLVGAFVAVGVVFALFTVWMTWVRARGLQVRCGCFGPNGGHVSQRTIARNLGLLLLAALGAFLASSTAPVLYEQSLWWSLSVIAFALGLAMVAAWRFAGPFLTLSEPKLRAGASRRS